MKKDRRYYKIVWAPINQFADTLPVAFPLCPFSAFARIYFQYGISIPNQTLGHANCLDTEPRVSSKTRLARLPL